MIGTEAEPMVGSRILSIYEAGVLGDPTEVQALQTVCKNFTPQKRAIFQDVLKLPQSGDPAVIMVTGPKYESPAARGYVFEILAEVCTHLLNGSKNLTLKDLILSPEQATAEAEYRRAAKALGLEVGEEEHDPEDPTRRRKIEKRRCFNCGKRGHLGAKCPEPDKRKKKPAKLDAPKPEGTPKT